MKRLRSSRAFMFISSVMLGLRILEMISSLMRVTVFVKQRGLGFGDWWDVALGGEYTFFMRYCNLILPLLFFDQFTKVGLISWGSQMS